MKSMSAIIRIPSLFKLSLLSVCLSIDECIQGDAMASLPEEILSAIVNKLQKRGALTAQRSVC